jgi:hypothetical protein
LPASVVRSHEADCDQGWTSAESRVPFSFIPKDGRDTGHGIIVTGCRIPRSRSHDATNDAQVRRSTRHIEPAHSRSPANRRLITHSQNVRTLS